MSISMDPPSFTYRTPREIRNDLSDVRRRIDEVRRALDIRDMVVSALTEHTGAGAARGLEGILDDARTAALTLGELEEELRLLREELFELHTIEQGRGRGG